MGLAYKQDQTNEALSEIQYAALTVDATELSDVSGQLTQSVEPCLNEPFKGTSKIK